MRPSAPHICDRGDLFAAQARGSSNNLHASCVNSHVVLANVAQAWKPSTADEDGKKEGLRCKTRGHGDLWQPLERHRLPSESRKRRTVIAHRNVETSR